MTSKVKLAAELAAVLSAETQLIGAFNDASAIAADALALLRIGTSVKRWAVRACNGEGHRDWDRAVRMEGRDRHPAHVWFWDDTDTAAHAKADARALAKASAIAARYGATVTIGGDPRGYTMRLILASGRTNTFGNDGWGVA